MNGKNFQKKQLQLSMIRVALIGPESTGKSTLCEELATHYKSSWVPEFAREYIEQLERQYTEKDVLFCIEQQIISEQKKIPLANKIIFNDSEPINGMVWLLDKYSHCPLWIEEEIKVNKYDLYLLTYPDIPFEQDNVRENGNRREYFFQWYQKLLQQFDCTFEIIKGTENLRFEKAKSAIEKYFSVE